MLMKLLSIFTCATSAWAQYAEYPREIGDYQPFTFTRLPSSIKFDAEVRSRTEYQSAINLLPGQNHLYELTRVRGGAQIRAASWATLYMQFQDAHALALSSQYRAANMWDTFDLRQGYVDFHDKHFRFIAGRQELRYGDERVVGISDWTNVSRTWDGFLVRIGDLKGKNQIDLFTTSVVDIFPRSLDKHGAGLTFHGAIGTIATVVPKTTFQPFLFVRALPRVKSQQGVYGDEVEFTPGILARRETKVGVDYTITATLQRGSYSNDSIHAGSAIIKVGYTSTAIPWGPRVGFEYDYATGNAHRNPTRISTNDQLYPSNHNAFGLVDLFGFQNIEQFRGTVDLTPVEHLSLFLQAGSLRTATTKDNVYNGAGSPLITGPLQGSDLGTEFDASAKYPLKKYFIIDVGVGHLFPGQGMLQNEHNVPLTLAYFGFTYRFRVNR
jgi:Alginate export